MGRPYALPGTIYMEGSSFAPRVGPSSRQCPSFRWPGRIGAGPQKGGGCPVLRHTTRTTRRCPITIEAMDVSPSYRHSRFFHGRSLKHGDVRDAWSGLGMVRVASGFPVCRVSSGMAMVPRSIFSLPGCVRLTKDPEQQPETRLIIGGCASCPSPPFRSEIRGVYSFRLSQVAFLARLVRFFVIQPRRYGMAGFQTVSG